VKPAAVTAIGAVIAAIQARGFALGNTRLVTLSPVQASSLANILGASSSSIPASSPVVAIEATKAGVIEALHIDLVKHLTESRSSSSTSAASVSSSADARISADDFVIAKDLAQHEEAIKYIFGDISAGTPPTAGQLRPVDKDYTGHTLCVIKPHAQLSHETGLILSSIQRAGFHVEELQTFSLEKHSAEEFLEVYKGVVSEYHLLVDQLASGPVLACALSHPAHGKNTSAVVAALRDLAGPADVELAKTLRPNSLRALFGKDRVRNAVHVTDLVDDGPLECEYFFKILAQ
jgi:nucleoside-diphosphate kinase